MTSASVTADSRWVTLGCLGKTHGLQGWMWVRSDCDPADAIFDYQPLHARQGKQLLPIRWEKSQLHAKGMIAKIKGIDTPEQAKAWVSALLEVPRDALPDAGKDCWYWADLVGLSVISTDGLEFGLVDHLFDTGGGAIMSVRADGKEHLIPFIMDQVVQSVDIEAKRITVDWDPDF